MEGLEPLRLTHDGVLLEGYIARPAGEGPFPAVMVMHSGMGLKKFECDKARAIAGHGYFAVATDMFGVDVRNIQVGDFAPYEKVRDRPDMMRDRIATWFDTVAALPEVDAARIGAFGFCFGGTCVLELARSGKDAKAVVSYHGVLTTHAPARKCTVKPVIAAYCGLEDPFAPAATIDGLRAELSAAQADYHIAEFARVGHSFTNPEAAEYAMPGLAYDAVTDAVSWAGTLALFERTMRG
jgi:dienelactone hydrolase